jgi:hypothetical protein
MTPSAVAAKLLQILDRSAKDGWLLVRSADEEALREAIRLLLLQQFADRS